MSRIPSKRLSSHLHYHTSSQAVKSEDNNDRTGRVGWQILWQMKVDCQNIEEKLGHLRADPQLHLKSIKARLKF